MARTRTPSFHRATPALPRPRAELAQPRRGGRFDSIDTDEDLLEGCREIIRSLGLGIRNRRPRFFDLYSTPRHRPTGFQLVSTMRSSAALADVTDPAWPVLLEEFAAAAIPIQVLPIEPSAGAEVLYRLQVTARSPLGALALNCGGVMVDDGWLRMLGGGGAGLPDLATASGLGDPAATIEPRGFVTVAYDVLGGEFAINGGALPGHRGEICYFAPDTLEWQPIGGGHTAFLRWAVTGGLEEFYGGVRWPDWRTEIAPLAPDRAVTLYPPLWSVKGRRDVASTTRGPVSLAELLSFRDATARQLDGLPDSARVHTRVVNDG